MDYRYPYGTGSDAELIVCAFMVRRKAKAGDDLRLDAELAELEHRRRTGQLAVAHLKYMQDHLVDQEIVKRGLLLGFSQGELADRLGMSKRDVNRFANASFVPAAISSPPPLFESLTSAFLATVWDSEATAARDYSTSDSEPAPIADGSNRHSDEMEV